MYSTSLYIQGKGVLEKPHQNIQAKYVNSSCFWAIFFIITKIQKW